MTSIQRILNTAKMIDGIGKVANYKPSSIKPNININKMGYPSTGSISRDIKVTDIRNQPITSNKLMETHRKQRVDQLATINNTQGLVSIDTNLSSAANKQVIDEIDTIIEKIRDNVETGAFFSIVVGDTYRLLRLFEQNVYKFDDQTLNDYKVYLDDLNDIIDSDKNEDLYKVIGEERQIGNLVSLVGQIFSRILELCDAMINNSDKSPNDKKLIVESQLKLKKFRSLNQRYHNAIKDDYDDKMKKLEKEKKDKNKQNIRVLERQTKILNELLTEARTGRKDETYSTYDSPPKPVTMMPFESPSREKPSPEAPATRYYDVYTTLQFPKGTTTVQEKKDVAKRVETLYNKLEEFKNNDDKDNYNDLKKQLNTLSKFANNYLLYK